MANIFTQFRLKYIGIKATCSTAATSGTPVGCTFGIYDDVSNTADLPTTVNDVLQLRSSALSLPYQTVPTELVWRPVDTQVWKYTTSDSGDARFTVFGCLVVASAPTGNSLFTAEIDYELVYKGSSADT
jgi:hypothetical protein